MRCIFCKKDSEFSRSKEHIVPASLGNKDHVLPPGWVCDDCNNYLSREVEAPFLNSDYGKRARFEMGIPSRRGRVPAITGFHSQSKTVINLLSDEKGLSIFACSEKDEDRFAHAFRTRKHGTLYIPASGDPSPSYETARFIAKVGLEVLAHWGLTVAGWNEEVANKRELDELRDYARRGRPDFIWPIHTRRIHPADRFFSDATSTTAQDFEIPLFSFFRGICMRYSS